MTGKLECMYCIVVVWQISIPNYVVMETITENTKYLYAAINGHTRTHLTKSSLHHSISLKISNLYLSRRTSIASY